MSLLAGTTWSATGEGMGTCKWAFNSDGTMVSTAPNGSVSTVYFSELEDGTFVIQTPNSTTNPNIINIFAGKHKNGVGIGDWVHYEGDANNSVLWPFHMTAS